MKRIILAASLVVIWVLLWGEASLANLLSGVALATVVLVAFPGDRPDDDIQYRLNVVTFLRLVGYMLNQLVRSNLLLTREVLSPRPALKTAVIALELDTRSPALITTMANLIALNPGTIVIEIDEPGEILYIHIFYLEDLEAVRDDVEDLQRLVIGAFTPQQREPKGRTTLKN